MLMRVRKVGGWIDGRRGQRPKGCFLCLGCIQNRLATLTGCVIVPWNEEFFEEPIVSVKLIDNKAFYGYRTRRTVNGKLYQEYFPLKPNGKKLSQRAAKQVKQQAEARDAELEVLATKDRQARKAERCFRPDGSVRGIGYTVKTEKSGTRTPLFIVGIHSELKNKVCTTSFSINAHGYDGAWQKAVDYFALHKGISKRTKLYKQIEAAKPLRRRR